MNQTYTCFLSLLIACCCLFGSAAQGQQKKVKIDDITYFQTVAEDTLTAQADSLPVFRIRPGTELNILVATLSEEADALLNPSLGTSLPNTTNNPDTRQPSGYLVDTKGYINFPLIGRVKLLGLSTHEAADTITRYLSKQATNPFVTVRVVNFQVTVLGEVGRPNVLNVSRERMTIPEAISLAGDLTIYGKRENVLVVREQNGKRQFGVIDLKDRSVFRSPYYYLQPNDMIYVEPKKSKKAQSGRIFPFLPTIFSGASLLITIAVLLLKR